LRYQGKMYRPPSEAQSYILQATIGCSWNECVYCDMYRAKNFRVRPVEQCLQDLRAAGEIYGHRVEKIFVADGDALVMEMDHWKAILSAAKEDFPRLRQVSCYATAETVAQKTDADLRELRALGLKVLYIGPESGDEATLRKIAKGPRPTGASRGEPYLFESHVAAGQRAKAAGMKVSAIFLLGVAGVENSQRHAEASARLITAMDPAFLAALTLTIVPGTPLAKTSARTGFQVPEPMDLLAELRTLVDLSRPTNALFRTNHASNYLPLGGSLPIDRSRILATIDAAVDGKVGLRPEWMRGL
jgi:radical SAM superfamily enzyme YgiQ (UPF0313 family)